MGNGLKKNIKLHLYRCRFIYSAFWISAIIFLTVCIGRHLWPFGPRSILKVDLFHQYAPYLEELRSRVLNGESLIYSWETGLGKDFIAQTAYYAASPLNILIFLFPEKLISEMIAFLVLIKISLSSASFTYYLREHFRRNDLSILIFGLMYGFCAFVTCYYWNIMWLDTVALFPLTALGCERLIREKKITLYYIALTLTMIVNFYLSVLVCILITLYAVIVALSETKVPEAPAASVINTDPAERSELPYSRWLIKAAVRFIIVSVLCAMTATFILAPVASALSETEVSSLVSPPFMFYNNIWQLIPSHFLGARDAVLARNEDLPNVYSGLLAVVLLPLYYNCRSVSRREKFLYTSFLLFMLFCASFCPMDYIIHGFHFPANLPHRYTFIYSFVLLCMAYRGGSVYLFPENSDNGVSLREKKIRYRRRALSSVYAAAVLYIAIILIYECFIVNLIPDIDHVLSWTDILLNVILMAVYLAVITAVLSTRKKAAKKAADASASAAENKPEKGNPGMAGIESGIAQDISPVTDLKISDPGMTGTESDTAQGIPAETAGGNAAESMNKRSRLKKYARIFLLPIFLVCVVIECVFSLYQNMYDTGDRHEYVSWLKDTADALEYMDEEQDGEFFRAEFRRFVTINEGSLYHFNSFSTFSSLAPGGISALMEHLGVAATGNSYRYYDTSPLIDAIFDIRYVMDREEDFPESDLAYKNRFVNQTGSVRIAVNDRVLPLGFMTKSGILDWKTTDSQPFEVQNDFIHCAAGIDRDVYTIIPPALIQATNMAVTDVNAVGDEFGYYLENPYDLSIIPSVHAEFVSDRDQYVTLYVDAPNAIRFIYSTASERQDREISAGRSLIDVGFVAEGEKIEADFVLTRRGAFDRSYPPYGNVRLFAAGWNDPVFQDAYDKLNSGALQVSSFTDTEIRGRVNASEDGIMMTSIPYTKGWDVFIDGSQVEKIGIGEGGLLGFSVAEGTHDILLQYHSPFIIPAFICSLLGPILFLIFKKKILTIC